LKRGSEVPAPTPILFHFPHGSCSPISLPQRRHQCPWATTISREIRITNKKNVIAPQKKNKKKQKAKNVRKNINKIKIKIKKSLISVVLQGPPVLCVLL